MSHVCIECGTAELRPEKVRLQGVVRSQPYEVEMLGLKCPNCGYSTVDAKGMTEFSRLLSDKWRSENGLLTSDEILARRASFHESQDQFAKRCKIGPATLKRIEKGKIQDIDTNRRILENTNTQVTIVNFNQYVYANVGSASYSRSSNVMDICSTGTNYSGAIRGAVNVIDIAKTSVNYAQIISREETTKGWDLNVTEAAAQTPPWTNIHPAIISRGHNARY
jgi:DNA-binding XRE family transcriptional regulator/predicted nucleic-acid-binding Zn-ribbon protein